MTRDEFAWRTVKDAGGLYVHTADAHEYPGRNHWDLDYCAARRHPGCELPKEAPA